LPDVYEYLKFREKDNPSALSWDKISKADFIPAGENINWSSIEQKAGTRINASHAFTTIKTNTDWLNKNMDKEYDLNIIQYKAKQNLLRNKVRENDSLVKLVKPMDIQPVAADYNTYFNNADKAKGERYQQWLKGIQADVYIQETANIIEDIFEEEHTNTVKK